MVTIYFQHWPKPPRNEIFWSLGGTSAAPHPRRPLTASILASLASVPIASNALFGNFYTLFHLFLSIFRDFQHTSPVLGPELLGTGRVSRTRRGFEAPL